MAFAIALESRLSRCPGVTTLGVRPNFNDYTPQEARLILQAETVYYPSGLYVHMLAAMGRKTFPSPATYAFAQDKIRQTALFQMLGVPHPRTRVYYGARQQEGILRDFSLPLVAKEARGSARGAGVFLIRDKEDLAAYCRRNHAAYIQEHLAMDRDVRVVIIGREIALTYWRVAPPGGFLNNVAAGGAIEFDPAPAQVRQLALETAANCGWNDVGLDLCLVDGAPLVLEANMKYGRQGFEKAGVDYYALMERLIRNGTI